LVDFHMNTLHNFKGEIGLDNDRYTIIIQGLYNNRWIITIKI
jgi:hypothetical protein